MDGNRFDDLMRSLGGSRSRREALAALAGLAGTALVGGAALADARSSRRRGKGKGQPKVQICHRGSDGAYHLITVSNRAVDKHIAKHGDFRYGECCSDSNCPVGSGLTCYHDAANPDATSACRCGASGLICVAGQTCVDGACVAG